MEVNEVDLKKPWGFGGSSFQMWMLNPGKNQLSFGYSWVLSLSHNHGSVQWLYLKGNYYWRDPFLTSIIMGASVLPGKLTYPLNTNGWKMYS